MQTIRLATVGAGPAGLMLALYLKQHAHRIGQPLHITLFDREGNHDHQDRSNPDRSYTIDITGHGVNAVLAVGENLIKRLDRELIPFRGVEADLIKQTLPYEDHGWTGSRGDICSALLHELQALETDAGSKVTVSLKWHCEVTAVDMNKAVLSYREGASASDGKSGNEVSQNPGTEIEAEFDLIVGADGAGSSTRRSLETNGALSTTKYSIPNYSRILHLDNTEAATKLDPSLLHLFSLKPWAVGGAILDVSAQSAGADLNAEATAKKFFVQMGYADDQRFASTDEAAAALNNISFSVRDSDHVSSARRLDEFVSRDEVEAFAARPVYHTGRTVRVSALTAGKCALLGDAGTAFPPVGQGVNAALEAAVVLGEEIIESMQSGSADLSAAASSYNTRWHPQAEACAEIANTVVYGSRLSLAKMLLQGITTKLSGVELAPAQLAKDRSLSYVSALRLARRRNAIALGLALLALLTALSLLAN